MVTTRPLYASEGVVIRRPAAHATRAPDPRATYLCYPSTDSSLNADDAETLAVFQELALRYTMEQTHSAVRAVLLRANKKCYSDVHAFLQTHMQRVALERGRLLAVPRVVAFPALMKFPTVAVVSGSDATFSDQWMTPLCQVIHRSFPVILVIRDGIENVRRMVEWLLERLDDYAGMKKREETWLGQQIDAWYASADERKAGRRTSAMTATADQQPRRLRTRSGRTTARLESLVGHDDSDDDFIFFDDGADSSDSGGEGEAPVSRRKRGMKRKRHGKAGAPRRRVKYGDLLLEALLQKLWDRMTIIQRASDLTLTWTATLREVIQEDLRMQLELCNGNLEPSVQCYCDTFEWIQTRIIAYRQLRRLPTSIRASTAEFTLATLAYRVLSEFLAFVNDWKPTSPSDSALVTKWKHEIKRQLERLEDTNHLHQFDISQYEQVVEHLDPYLLICIEHLDHINLQVLRDFVDLWSHYTDRQLELTHSTRVGFILGVTTTTSQTLRQLGLSIMRRLDIQFFPLEDSKTRSQDIYDALFVQNHYPLCLRGDALRLLDDRHLTSQSLTAFTQVLEFVALCHFQDSPWSFLSHFALDTHKHKPLFSDLPRHSPLRRWVVRKKFRGRSLGDMLSCFSDEGVSKLLANFRAPGPSNDQFSSLDRELRRFCDQRANWVVGWKCFRLACAWFQLEETGEGFVDCLATALDGHAGSLQKVEWCIAKIKADPIQRLLEMLEDWAFAAAPSHDVSLKREVNELVILATHIRDTSSDPETIRMRPHFQDEVASFFRDRIVRLMDLEQPVSGSGQAIVSDWMFAMKNPASTRANVTLNLHEDVIDSLSRLDDETFHRSAAVGDLALAFMHYREHATLQLGVADWFAAFADAVHEEVGDNADAADDDDVAVVTSEEALNARFARALATLRLWGYIKGPDGVRGSGRRHQDARVDKRIFM